jgi:FtsZ-binding cell division protein ZapB
MSLIKIDQAKKTKAAKESRVSELRKLLADSDYKVTTDYDKPNEDVKTQRQAWRDEIRELLA